MGHEPNFIPDDLRAKLDADADEAARKGDRDCSHILRQLAAYRGNDAGQFARDLGAEACTIRYKSAKELMTLVVQVEAAAEKKGERHPLNGEDRGRRTRK
jgi:hypothetical protein